MYGGDPHSTTPIRGTIILRASPATRMVRPVMAPAALLLAEDDTQNNSPGRQLTVSKECTSPHLVWDRADCPHPHPVRSIGRLKGHGGLPARVSLELGPSSPAQRQMEKEGTSLWWTNSHPSPPPGFQLLMANRSPGVDNPPPPPDESSA